MRSLCAGRVSERGESGEQTDGRKQQRQGDDEEKSIVCVNEEEAELMNTGAYWLKALTFPWLFYKSRRYTDWCDISFEFVTKEKQLV